MAEKTTRSKPRGPTRAKLLEQIGEHEEILAEKDSELAEMKQQMQTLAQVPPVLFTISVNRVTGLITSVPLIGEESSVKDLRLLLKALNIYQSNVVDLMTDMVLKNEEEATDDNEEVVNEEEVDNEEVVNEEPSDE